MSKAAKITLGIVVALVVVFCVGSLVLDRHILNQTYTRYTGPDTPLILDDVDIEDDYPMQDVQFELNGQTLRGHVYGADNTQGLVIVRHGIFSEHQDYLALITALVDRGWKVFAYDALGCGESDGDTVRGLAQSPLDVRAAVRFADESGMADGLPMMLLGHSWGGYGVAGALDFADVRDRVSACVTMSGFDTPTGIIMLWAESSFGPLALTQLPFIELWGHLDFGVDADRSGARAIRESGVPTLVIHFRLCRVRRRRVSHSSRNLRTGGTGITTTSIHPSPPRIWMNAASSLSRCKLNTGKTCPKRSWTSSWPRLTSAAPTRQTPS